MKKWVCRNACKGNIGDCVLMVDDERVAKPENCTFGDKEKDVSKWEKVG